MPVTLKGFDEAKAALLGFFNGFDDGLRDVGQEAAKMIVSETMQGRGADDQPFAPYSESYAKQLKAAAAKPTAPVNLRGVFVDGPGPGHKGQKPGVIRRPLRQPGDVVDPASELSADLIDAQAEDGTITLTYKPRAKPHMLTHQTGDGRLPARPWFTVRRKAIREMITDRVGKLLAGMVERFNRGT